MGRQFKEQRKDFLHSMSKFFRKHNKKENNKKKERHSKKEKYKKAKKKKESRMVSYAP